MEPLKMRCKFGVISRPDGSAMYCEGDTTVISGIYGPVECKMKNLLIDKAHVEAHYRPKAGFPGVQDRYNENIIKNICETSLAATLYPRSSVLIIIQEMHNNGQLISCAINSACLAAMDSGIYMKFMFGAVTCFLKNDGDFVMKSPTEKHEIKASFVFVFDSVQFKIIASHTEGLFSKEEYEKGLNFCRLRCNDIFKFFKESVKGNFIEYRSQIKSNSES